MTVSLLAAAVVVTVWASALAAAPVQAASTIAEIPGAESPAGTWVCFDPGFPDPCHRRIHAAGLASERHGWAVGAAGVIMRWDGSRWYPVGSPTRSDLHGLHVVSEREAWAVGDDSTIVRFDGLRWSRLPYDRGRPLLGVYAVAPDDVWMVGSAGFILHWDGASFTVHTSGVTDDLHAVAMVQSRNGRATDGWIGGGYALLRWDGAEWRPAPQPPDTHHDLRDIQLTSARAGWAVGRTILRLDGDVWREAVSARDVDGVLLDLDLESAELGWAVGGTRLWRLFDSGWSVTADTVHRGDFYPLEFFAAATVPALGRGWAFATAMDGAAEVWRLSTGGGAPVVDARYTPLEIEAISVVSDRNAWRATESGLLEHWDGWSWSASRGGQHDDDFFMDLDAHGSDVAWALSDGHLMLRWDGRQWLKTPLPAVRGLRGVAVADPDAAWAVGNSGEIIAWDGAAWSGAISPTDQRLNAVDARSADDAWAVGGAIVRWDGRRWNLVDGPASAGLSDVAAIGPNSAWAVGSDPGSGRSMLLHWDGTEWGATDVPRPPQPHLGNLHHVAANHEQDVWAAGMMGGLVHWNGVRWSWQPSPRPWLLNDIDFGGGAGWAAGTEMLRYVPPPGPNALYVPAAHR